MTSASQTERARLHAPRPVAIVSAMQLPQNSGRSMQVSWQSSLAQKTSAPKRRAVDAVVRPKHWSSHAPLGSPPHAARQDSSSVHE